MVAHTPDDIETILEDGEENDCSKNDSSAAQEKGSSYVVDRSTNCDNVLQVFQNPQVIGFLRGLMTHQPPQNVQSSQFSHTVTSQGLISPQDEKPPNPDRNDSTVSQADDSSAEPECLENLTQEYERTEKRGPLISSEKLQKVTQDLIRGIYRTEKFEQVMEKIFPFKSIEGLEVNKVNIEVWRKISHSTKHSNIRFQNLQNLILKNQSIICFLLDSLYKGTKLTDPQELVKLVEVSLKKCADSAMIFGKLTKICSHCVKIV